MRRIMPRYIGFTDAFQKTVRFILFLCLICLLVVPVVADETNVTDLNESLICSNETESNGSDNETYPSPFGVNISNLNESNNNDGNATDSNNIPSNGTESNVENIGDTPHQIDSTDNNSEDSSTNLSLAARYGLDSKEDLLHALFGEIFPPQYANMTDKEIEIFINRIAEINRNSTGIPVETRHVERVHKDEGQQDLFKLFSSPLQSGLIPSAYDLRNTSGVTPVVNQFLTGTCWVYAVVAAAETNAIKNRYATKDTIDLAEYQPAYFHTHRDGVTAPDNKGNVLDEFKTLTGDNVQTNDWIGGGEFPEYLLRTLAAGIGFADQDNYIQLSVPSTWFDFSPPGPEMATADNSYVLNGYTWVNINERDEIKQLIQKNGGAVTTMLVNKTCLQLKEYVGRESLTYYNPVYDGEGHAVCIVGWDDNFPKEYFVNHPASDGAWLIKNSWGTANSFIPGFLPGYLTFGDGYIWVSYSEKLTDVIFVDVIPASLKGYDYIYQYDGGTANKDVGEQYTEYDGTIKARNIFTAVGNQMINSVSFETENTNLDYTIEIVKNGKTVSTTTGSLVYIGYYIIPLNTPVSLVNKEEFEVRVTLEKNDGDVEVSFPADTNKIVRSNQSDPTSSIQKTYTSATSGTKSSYYDADLGRWVDITVSGDNFRIKAFAENDKPSVNKILLTSDDWYNLLGTDIIFNGNLRLKANCYPENSLQSVTWTTSDSSIATVDATGWVHPVSEGTVTITATAKDGSGVYAEQKVELSKVLFLFWLFVKGEQKSMSVGDTDYLIHPLDKMDQMDMMKTTSVLPPVVKSPAIERNTTDANISLSPSKEIIQTVSGSSGLKSIDAEDNSVAITKATINSYLSSKQQKTLNAENPSNESKKSNTPLLTNTPPLTASPGTIWTSNNTKVVTVDNNGLVTAVGPGYATVTGVVDGVTYTVEYHVVGSGTVTSVTLNGPSSVLVGDTITLRANVLPSYATYKSVNWTSSSNAVQLTPSSDTLSCTVKGIKTASSVLITATSDDISSGQKAETFIEVYQPSVTPTPITTVMPTPKPTPIPSTEPGSFPLHRSPWDDTYADVGASISLYAPLPQQYNTYQWSWTSVYSTYIEHDTSDPVGSYSYYYDRDNKNVWISFIPEFVGKATFRLKFMNTNTGEYAISSPYELEFIQDYDITIEGSETAKVGDTVWYTAHPNPFTNYDTFKWKVTSGSDKITDYDDNLWTIATHEPVVEFKATNPGAVTISITPNHAYRGSTAYKTITIVRPVKSISISGDNSVAVGNTVTLTASISPNDATNKEVSWSISSGSGTIISTTNADSSGKSTCTVRPDKAGTIAVLAKAKDASGVTAMHQIAVSQPVTNIILTGEDTVEVGRTISLSVTLEPADATEKTVLFSYDNSTVLMVDENGVVTGLAGGVANVTATASGGISKSKMIRVIVPVSSVSITGNDSVSIGKTTKLTAIVLPADATNKTVFWNSSNTAVATVDNTGLVTGVSAGTCIISATADGISQNKVISVIIPVESVSISGNNTVVEGETITLSAEVLPYNATFKMVTWYSDNTTVATVDTFGVVTGVSLGTCNITATADGVSQNKSITVMEKTIPVESIIVSGETMVLTGENITLKADVYPKNATNNIVHWSSDNTTIATVDNGTVTGMSAGTCNITATADTVSKTKTITVISPLSLIHVVGIDTHMYKDVCGTLSLIADRPNLLTDNTVRWESSNSEKLMITTDGRYTVCSGNGTVDVRAYDGTNLIVQETITLHAINQSEIRYTESTFSMKDRYQYTVLLGEDMPSVLPAIVIENSGGISYAVNESLMPCIVKEHVSFMQSDKELSWNSSGFSVDTDSQIHIDTSVHTGQLTVIYTGFFPCDCNLDNCIDVTDSAIIGTYIGMAANGGIWFTDCLDCNLYYADGNGDGTIDVADLRDVNRHMIGLDD